MRPTTAGATTREAQSTVTDEAPLTARTLEALRELSNEAVEEVFAKHDEDKSGDLDIFELANAMAQLIGRPLATKQIMAMADSFGSDASSLTLPQFVDLVKMFDWAAETPRLLRERQERLYELVFEREQLGFGVKNNKEEGSLIVSRVVDESLAGLVLPNDRVLAVNGAPLGHVMDHKASLSYRRC